MSEGPEFVFFGLNWPSISALNGEGLALVSDSRTGPDSNTRNAAGSWPAGACTTLQTDACTTPCASPSPTAITLGKSNPPASAPRLRRSRSRAHGIYLPLTVSRLAARALERSRSAAMGDPGDAHRCEPGPRVGYLQGAAFLALMRQLCERGTCAQEDRNPRRVFGIEFLEESFSRLG